MCQACPGTRFIFIYRFSLNTLWNILKSLKYKFLVIRMYWWIYLNSCFYFISNPSYYIIIDICIEKSNVALIIMMLKISSALQLTFKNYQSRQYSAPFSLRRKEDSLQWIANFPFCETAFCALRLSVVTSGNLLLGHQAIIIISVIPCRTFLWNCSEPMVQHNCRMAIFQITNFNYWGQWPYTSIPRLAIPPPSCIRHNKKKTAHKLFSFQRARKLLVGTCQP